MKKYFLVLTLLLAYYQSSSQEFGARIKLKPEVAKKFKATEDVEMKTLSLKHGVTLRQTYPSAKNPELLLYYTIGIQDSKDTGECYTNDFIATGKFENDVYFYQEVHPASCLNPVPVRRRLCLRRIMEVGSACKGKKTDKHTGRTCIDIATEAVASAEQCCSLSRTKEFFY